MIAIGAIFDSTVLSAVGIVVGLAAVSLLGFLAVLRLRPTLRRQSNNKFIELVFGVTSGLYAILLAFVVVVVWQDFTDAQSEVQTEVTRVSNLIRDSAVFPPAVRVAMRKNILTYIDDVARLEWPQMANGNSDPQTAAAYEGIWNQYYTYSPTTSQQQQLYEVSLTRLNDLGQARRLRLLHSRSTVPLLLWILLGLGALVTTGFTYVYWSRNNRTQAIVITALGALIGFVFFLIYALQHPFAGDVKIPPESFQQLSEQYEGHPL